MQLVLIELNEINFEYAKKYFDVLKIDTIKKISKELINTESENSDELLEPWIQWHSIHTGCSAKDHGVFRLGDTINSKKTQLFEELEADNLKVGSISAMNSINNLKDPSYFIPDPWTKTKSDDSFFSKIITSVLKDTVNNNASGKFSIKNYFYLIIIFLRFVRLKKYTNFLKLFFNSFFGKWRKALFLDLLLHEIHLNLLIAKKPNFSCVFFNAGAHIQHHYLLNSLANTTNIKNPEKIIDKNKDPFKEMLEVYDDILKDYFIHTENIIIATGLTQSIVKKPHYYYRLTDHKNFLKNLDLDFINVEPRMSRDFLIHFSDNNNRDKTYEKLRKIKINNEFIFGILDLRDKSIFVTLTYNKEIFKDDIINVNNKNFKIYDQVVFVAFKNGYHNGKGFLFADGKIKKNFDNSQKIKIFEIKNIIKSFFKKKINI
tara:strand:- start:240 stop:1532 length:1293 start_codon:yes stop_codon:yes gene_type:complete